MVIYDKKIVVTACVMGAITIALGAFGAHGLKTVIGENQISIFETGVRYQMFHVLALLVIGFANAITPNLRKWVFLFFLFVIILFSGSLYLLALDEVFAFNASSIGFIKPIGGLLLIFGWMRLAFGMFTLR